MITLEQIRLLNRQWGSSTQVRPLGVPLRQIEPLFVFFISVGFRLGAELSSALHSLVAVRMLDRQKGIKYLYTQ